MLYHQSEKSKHSDRVSVLNKVEDKYNWKNVNFPASFDDITTFETNSRICVNIFGHCGEKNEINPKRLGHIPYIKNGNMNLLLIRTNTITATIYTLRNSKTYCTQPQQQTIRIAATVPFAEKS